MKLRKEHRVNRLAHLNESRTFRTRFSRLIELRRRNLDELDAGDRQAMQTAFQEADTSCEGMLSSRQLKAALNWLGLRAKNDAERHEVAHICSEVGVAGDVDLVAFVFEAVPRTRQKLRELRRPLLQWQFRAYDKDNSGRLSSDECAAIFEQCSIWDLDSAGLRDIKRMFDEKVKEVRDPVTAEVNFAGFETLMSEVYERVQRAQRHREARIEQSERLEEVDVKAHRQELVSLYEAFQHEAGDSRVLLRSRLPALLESRALYPDDPSVQQKLDNIVEDITGGGDGVLAFKDFLRVVRFMREMIVSGSHVQLSLMFGRLDRTRKGVLHHANVINLIDMMGLVPPKPEDQVELQRLLAEARANGSGEVDLPEFERLVLRVKERMKATQQIRVSKAIHELRLHEAEVQRLRELFFAADAHDVGVLTADHLWKALEGTPRTMDHKEVEVAMRRLCPSGESFDFEKFLRFMWFHERGEGPPRSGGTERLMTTSSFSG